MHQARPYVAIVVALASGAAGTITGGMLGMRTAHGLDLFGLLLVGALSVRASA